MCFLKDAKFQDAILQEIVCPYKGCTFFFFREDYKSLNQKPIVPFFRMKCSFAQSVKGLRGEL